MTMAAHFAKRNTKFGGDGKRGRAKACPVPRHGIPSPQPPSFLPARAFSLAREARHQFCSKKVRISSNKRTSIKLSGILPIDSAARSAAENGNTGSPRHEARRANYRFGSQKIRKSILVRLLYQVRTYFEQKTD